MSAVTAALIMGGAQLASGIAGAFGSRSAAKKQARAARRALALQRQMFATQQANLEPFRASGVQAQNRLMSLLGLGGDAGAEGYGSLARDFGMQDFQADPGYGFRMSEGLKALERSAAGRGGAASGSAMKGITRFGQDLASQEYQNAYARYMANRQAKLAPLQNLMGMGANAAAGLSSAAGQFGQVGGQSYGDIGNAQAAGIMGPVNALAGGIGGAVNAYQFNQMMDRMYPQNTSTSIYPSSPLPGLGAQGYASNPNLDLGGGMSINAPWRYTGQ
jgi:hypothetical protein